MVVVRDPTQEIIEAVRLYVETFEAPAYPGGDAQLFMETHQFEPTPMGFWKYFQALLKEIECSH